MSIRRWECDYHRYEGDQMWEDPEGPYVTYADHVAAVVEAVADAYLAGYLIAIRDRQDPA